MHMDCRNVSRVWRLAGSLARTNVQRRIGLPTDGVECPCHVTLQDMQDMGVNPQA